MLFSCMFRGFCLYLFNISSFCKIILTSKFIIFLSNLGFSFYRIYNLRILIFNLNMYIFIYNSSLLPLIKRLFNNICSTVLYGCYNIFYISGIGYKLWVENGNIFLRLGYSNIFHLVMPCGIYFIFINRYRFGLYSFDSCVLNKFCYYLRSLKQNNIYKQRGLYFENEMLLLKKVRNKKIFF